MNKLFSKNLQYFYNEIPQYYELIKNIKTRRFKIINDNGLNILDTETNEYRANLFNGFAMTIFLLGLIFLFYCIGIVLSLAIASV